MAASRLTGLGLAAVYFASLQATLFFAAGGKPGRLDAGAADISGSPARLTEGMRPFPAGLDGCVQLPVRAAGWWPGDDGPQDLIASNDGILHNGVAFSAARDAAGFSLDGVDDYVEVPSSAALTPVTSFTVAAWIRMESVYSAAGQCVVVKGIDTETALDWALCVSASGYLRPHVAVDDWSNGWRFFDCATLLRPGTWYHVAMSARAQAEGSMPAALSCYLDGVLDGSQPLPGAPLRVSDQPLRIGAYAPVGGTVSKAFFGGIIDEVTFFDRALSDCEVRELADGGTGGHCKGDTDGDGVADPRDDCPDIPDPAQEDADGDGAGDLCDCSPAAPDLRSVPGVVGGLRAGESGVDSLGWCTQARFAGSATSYDVCRGELGHLPVGSEDYAEACVEASAPATVSSDPLLPDPGSGFWYLVRGRNGCGVGTYGYQSDGTERISSGCP